MDNNNGHVFHPQSQSPRECSHYNDHVQHKIRRQLVTTAENDGQFELKVTEATLEGSMINMQHTPAVVCRQHPPVRIICLKGNEITKLSESFFDELPYLKWLDLRDNKLLSLPKLYSRHENLETLLLHCNRITALPPTLALAANLKVIGLTGNPISDPPAEILKDGCRKILQYLHGRQGELATAPGKVDETSDKQLLEDLKKTAIKQVGRPYSSAKSLERQVQASTSSKSAKSEGIQKSGTEKMIYTWDLWKRIPYDGPSMTDLLKTSMEDVQKLEARKLNEQQQATLQKWKNKEVLKQWRDEMRSMQIKIKPNPNVNSATSAPFGNDFNKEASLKVRARRPSQVNKDLYTCIDKLKEFDTNPLHDTDLALQRLREIEIVKRRLMEIKTSIHVLP